MKYCLNADFLFFFKVFAASNGFHPPSSDDDDDSDDSDDYGRATNGRGGRLTAEVTVTKACVCGKTIPHKPLWKIKQSPG